jgi:hypothetical protein
MSVSYECCVLSGRGLCDELIPRPEESYRLWCVWVCSWSVIKMTRPRPPKGCRAIKKKLGGRSELRLSTGGGHVFFATLSIRTVQLIQHSLQLVRTDLSLWMKSWSLKLTAHIHLVQVVKFVTLELHSPLHIYDAVFNRYGGGDLCVNVSIQTFVIVIKFTKLNNSLIIKCNLYNLHFI